MIRKIVVILGLILLIGVSLWLIKETKPTSLNPVPGKPKISENMLLSDKVYAYKADSIDGLCPENTELCAVENVVKCTIKPTIPQCGDLKLPRFVFMSGNNIERPTEISYKITKYSNDANKRTSIYTESSCNAAWFGICQGKIVYILNNTPDGWIVEDIYSIEE